MKTGFKHSKETIEKIRRANLGRVFSKESIRKISESKMGKTLSESTKEKMRESAKRGHLSHSWKGGITPENKKIRNSIEYKEWRTKVFERDNYQCLWCGVSGSKKYLQADHIKPFCRFPELRMEITNGRTLCIDCHSKTDSYKGRANKNYKLT